MEKITAATAVPTAQTEAIIDILVSLVIDD
jgi:hypothetical protein